MATADRLPVSLLFFFNDTATTEIYTLSLHDALPISRGFSTSAATSAAAASGAGAGSGSGSSANISLIFCSTVDRKSTRLNSSHVRISYAVFCLQKKTARHSADGVDRADSLSCQIRGQ